MSHGDIDTGPPERVAIRHAMVSQLGDRLTYREKRNGKERVIEGTLVNFRDADLTDASGEVLPAVFCQILCDDGRKRWTRAMAVTITPPTEKEGR